MATMGQARPMGAGAFAQQRHATPPAAWKQRVRTYLLARWRRPAEAAQRTVRALRPIEKAGWLVEHDLATPRGNRDHVVVGPGGAFLLDTKVLGGEIAVEDGVLRVSWLEDPDDGYESPRLAPRMRAAASALHHDLRTQTRVSVPVRPVVVIWGRFDQRIVEHDGLAYVRGDALSEWLEARPRSISTGALALLTERFTRD